MQSAVVWRRLEAGTTYFMKRNSDEDSLKVVMTDLIYVWVRHYTVEEIREICGELNPLIEFDEKAIVKKVWSLFDEVARNKGNSGSSSVTVNVLDDGSLLLKLRTEMDGVAFKFALNVNKESPLVFFKEVTTSIVSSAEELLLRQELLCSLLEKKDSEISQYKLEGASLSRRNVETQQFVRADFLSKPYLKGHVSGLSEELLSVIDTFHSKSDTVPNPEDQYSRTIENMSNQQTIKKLTAKVEGSSDARKINVTSVESNSSASEENGVNNSDKVSKPKRPKLNL